MKRFQNTARTALVFAGMFAAAALASHQAEAKCTYKNETRKGYYRGGNSSFYVKNDKVCKKAAAEARRRYCDARGKVLVYKWSRKKIYRKFMKQTQCRVYYRCTYRVRRCTKPRTRTRSGYYRGGNSSFYVKNDKVCKKAAAEARRRYCDARGKVLVYKWSRKKIYRKFMKQTQCRVYYRCTYRTR